MRTKFRIVFFVSLLMGLVVVSTGIPCGSYTGTPCSGFYFAQADQVPFMSLLLCSFVVMISRAALCGCCAVVFFCRYGSLGAAASTTGSPPSSRPICLAVLSLVFCLYSHPLVGAIGIRLRSSLRSLLSRTKPGPLTAFRINVCLLLDVVLIVNVWVLGCCG